MPCPETLPVCGGRRRLPGVRAWFNPWCDRHLWLVREGSGFQGRLLEVLAPELLSCALRQNRRNPGDGGVASAEGSMPEAWGGDTDSPVLPGCGGRGAAEGESELEGFGLHPALWGVTFIRVESGLFILSGEGRGLKYLIRDVEVLT